MKIALTKDFIDKHLWVLFCCFHENSIYFFIILTVIVNIIVTILIIYE